MYNLNVEKIKPHIDYSPDDINISSAFIKKHQRYRRYSKVANFFPRAFIKFAIPLAHRLGLHDVVYALKNDLPFRRITSLNKNRVKNPSTYGSGYGYEDEAEELKVALFYKSLVQPGRDAPKLFGHGANTIKRAIEASGAKRVVNFGVSYGVIDFWLAKRFSNVEFIGIDRAQAVKKLNDTDFNLPNLNFVAADIMEYLGKETDLSGTLLFHMRTGTLLPQSFMEDLYAVASSAGLLGVVGIETYGYSWELGGLYYQSPNPKPSVSFRKTMILHNYEGMLRGVGLSLKSMEYVKLEKEEEGFRLQTFIALRDKQPRSP